MQEKEHRTIENIPEGVSWGKILNNPRKIKMLVELSKGDLPKSKIADILDIKIPTVNLYVREVTDLGIVEEYPLLKDGRYLVHMVRLRCLSVKVDFEKLIETEGWKDAPE